MLKIITATVFLLLPVLAFAQSQKTTATFGRHSDCASGRGACSFSVLSNPQVFEGMVSRKIAEGVFVLEITRSQLSEDEQTRIAGKPFDALKDKANTVFIQQESIFLDTQTLKNLGLKSANNKIEAGNYPMTITKDKVEIIFDLKTD